MKNAQWLAGSLPRSSGVDRGLIDLTSWLGSKGVWGDIYSPLLFRNSRNKTGFHRTLQT
jgi:hypothetical protein